MQTLPPLPVPPVLLDDAALRSWPLPALQGDGDKEDRGAVVIVGGSSEIAGAVLLAAVAALRAGAGKVVVATVESAALALAIALPEARVIGLPATAAGGIDPAGAEQLQGCLGRAAALLVGPGMQDEQASCALACRLRERWPQLPTVLDAGAINAAAQASAGGPVVITPHAGEMAHLTGQTKDDVLRDPPAAAAAAALRLNAIVALKGARTVIVQPDGGSWLHEASIVGLGTAGSGDVLAGIVAGLAARGTPLAQATAWGVALHARAGQRLADRMGSVGYLAREISAEVPGLMEQLAG